MKNILFTPNPEIHRLKKFHARLRNTTLKNKVQNEIIRLEAGDAGEKIVANQIQKVAQKITLHCFHNVMMNSNGLFQMDFLIVTNKMLLIVEVKNIIGHITLTKNPQQLIRKQVNGKVDKFRSPIIQINKYIKLMEKWSVQNNFSLPVYGIVIFPALSSIVSGDHAEGFIIDLVEIQEFIEKKHEELKNSDHIEYVKNQLKNEMIHDFKVHVQKRFPFVKNDLANGVICNYCYSNAMIPIKRVWRCTVCQQKNSEAAKEAIDELFLYFPKACTKKQVGEWLVNASRNELIHLLKQPEIVPLGKYRSASYIHRNYI